MPGKLLRQNISARQTAAYIVASLLGLLIIGAPVQLYRDLTPSSRIPGDPLHSGKLLILTHRQPEGLLSGDGMRNFSAEEIEKISRQPWAQDAAPFIPSSFDASIGLRIGTEGFSTAIFFEGIPARFIDLPGGCPQFDPAAPEVSIILPRDYLTLYNFGFAPARGLPSLDEATLRLLPLQVTLSGNGKSRTLPGRIVGFSARLSTIGAPAEFVDWANREFGTGELTDPSRIAVSTGNLSLADAEKYLADNGLAATGSDGNSSRMSRFLNIAATIVIAIGAIISVLAVGILLLSVFLLIQKNRQVLSDLMKCRGSRYVAASAVAPRFHGRLTVACVTCHSCDYSDGDSPERPDYLSYNPPDTVKPEQLSVFGRLCLQNTTAFANFANK